jgi:hypothetical protein
VSRGVLLARLGRRDEALRDAQIVLASDASTKELLQTACILSLTSRTKPDDAEVAVSLLDRAITQDPTWIKIAKTDSDLDPLRKRSDFEAVLLSAEQRLDRDSIAKRAMQQLEGRTGENIDDQ